MIKGNIPGGRGFSPIRGVKIQDSYAAFPEPLKLPDGRVLENISNEDIFTMMLGKNYEEALAQRGMKPEYPEKVVGLKYRRWTHLIDTPPSHEEENSVDLGIKAVNGLLNSLDLPPDNIDFVIYSSTTPHKITTASSCAVGDKTGIKAPSIDLKAGCTSGLYALMTAALYVKAGFERVLLVAAETPSKYANPKIQETVMGVGDGAVAFLLTRGEEQAGLLGGFLGADGELGKLVNTPGLLPPTHEAIDAGLYFYHGDSSALKEAVPARYIDAMQGALGISGLKPGDLDLYIPHQINKALTGKVAELLGIPAEKQYHNLHKYGNVAGAAALLALHDALNDNSVKTGYKVGMNVVGGGLTWGGLVWQF